MFLGMDWLIRMPTHGRVIWRTSINEVTQGWAWMVPVEQLSLGQTLVTPSARNLDLRSARSR
jgi:hypothetical protein